MGTRSLTRVYEISGTRKNKDVHTRLINMYRQMDGYPSGHGMELVEFLRNIKLVNGLSMGDRERLANGMDCLAAQIVSHFKGDRAGDIYLMNPNYKPRIWGAEFCYDIYEKDKQIWLEIWSGYGEKASGWLKIWEGYPKDFDLTDISEDNR